MKDRREGSIVNLIQINYTSKYEKSSCNYGFKI